MNTMNRLRVILLLLLLVIGGGAEAVDLEVLFVGNSLTFYNNLPGTFGSLATAGGKDVHVDQSTPSGYNLTQHSVLAATLAKIAERSWDHVLLQEASLYPVIPFYRDGFFYPAVNTLDGLIEASGSVTTLLAIWARETGGSYCIGARCTPNYPDYFAMQADMSASHATLAAQVGAQVVPAGDVWATALQADPGSPLWSADGNHPSPEGSYLVACVLYARFFDESPVGIDYYGTIDPARALFYQQIASQIVTAAPDGPAEQPATRLLPSHPNPFNPKTTLRFELGEESAVSLEIFDTSGRRVDRIDLGVMGAGSHSAEWDAKDAPGGVYLLRMNAGGTSDTSKLTLLK